MNQTRMAGEIRDIPVVVRRQTSEAAEAYADIGARLRRLDPAVVVTAARSSSDHASIYLKSLVKTPPRLERSALVAISQSGTSPDLLSLVDTGRDGGALTIAPGSPAIQHAEVSALLLAGPEISVAATKSHLASLVDCAAIVAEWSGDGRLSAAIEVLPVGCDWSAADEAFEKGGPIFCVGRGTGLSITFESALKFKATCGLHADGYSSAKVLHSPVTLAASGLRALFFITSDKSRVPLCRAVAFYGFVERLARRLGRDPDNSLHLNMVTRTV